MHVSCKKFVQQQFLAIGMSCQTNHTSRCLAWQCSKHCFTHMLCREPKHIVAAHCLIQVQQPDAAPSTAPGVTEALLLQQLLRARASAGGAVIDPAVQLCVTCEVCRRPATKECWTCGMAICDFCTRRQHWKVGLCRSQESKPRIESALSVVHDWRCSASKRLRKHHAWFCRRMADLCSA
jgi:hypothetical protein